MHIKPTRALGAMLGQTVGAPYRMGTQPETGLTACLTASGEPGYRTQFDEYCHTYPDSPTETPWWEEPGTPWEPPPPEPPEPAAPELPPGFVAPGPTELHPDRWDLDACTYTVAYGDTYVGLAKTYLDQTGARWREIWALNRTTTPNPDVIGIGQVLQMDQESCDNMRRWVNRGGPNVNPSTIGPATAGDTARKYWKWAAAAAVIGGGIYWMS